MKLFTIFNAVFGLSIGTMCPALFTMLKVSKPADFVAPTTSLSTFHGVNYV